jgi:single-stranded-DNA-specific exonuclease
MLSIESMNIARKSYSDKAKKLMKNLTFDNDEVCIINATEYPEGVVGIVAGEAQKVFSKPAIVLVEKDGKLTGSVRSSKGIDLQEILKKEQDKGNIVSFGGHAAAAGVTIEEGKLDEFRESLNKELIEMLENMEYIEEELIIDELIEIEHINESTFDIINQLPYDNRTFMSPTFALTDVEVTSTKTSKNNPNNICFTIKDECGKKIDLWAWSMAKQYEEMGKPKKMHIAGQIERNFMNPKYFTLKVIDFMGA